MRTEQRLWTNEDGWSIAKEGGLGADARAVLVFGSRAVLKQGRLLDEVREFYPKAHVIGCSSAGEIAGTCVLDDSLVVTAARFEHAQLRFAKTELSGMGDSFEAGVRIASSLLGKDLIHVVVFSDGLHVNGSELAKGLREKLPLDVAVTGGLAGDGSAFEKTLVLLDDKPKESMIAAIGFYGSALQIGYGSMGGWTSFGQDRLVTRAKGNVLYELDGRSALDLYKEYLGDHAKGLPATGLLFPLSIRDATGQHGLVRTILAIDENEGSMTFAGDIPEHTYVRLMKASIDGLVDGASEAAVASRDKMGSHAASLAILVSCVGRKLVLKQRVEEEVEAVGGILGDRATLAGFYSYGEICPLGKTAGESMLHNQTMTITTFSENERCV